MATLHDYYNINDDAYNNIVNGQDVGQTFTTTASYVISSVKVKLYRVGADLSDIVLSLYNTTAGLPSGVALTTSTKDATLITTDSAGAWYEFVLDTSVVLEYNTKYAIGINYAGGYDGDHCLRWFFDNTDAYAGGNVVYTGGGTWHATTGDGMFETWGDDITTSSSSVSTTTESTSTSSQTTSSSSSSLTISSSSSSSSQTTSSSSTTDTETTTSSSSSSTSQTTSSSSQTTSSSSQTISSSSSSQSTSSSSSTQTTSSSSSSFSYSSSSSSSSFTISSSSSSHTTSSSSQTTSSSSSSSYSTSSTSITIFIRPRSMGVIKEKIAMIHSIK